MQTAGSAASVVAAIAEEAAAQEERIGREAEVAASESRERAAIADVAIADRERRVAAAGRLWAERIAETDWESRRRILEQREEWIRRVVERALAAEESDADRLRLLQAFVREGIARVGGEVCEVALSAADRSRFSEEWLATLGAVPSSEPAPIAGGCIVRSGDTIFDNSYEARSRRLEPEWRAALCALYGGAP